MVSSRTLKELRNVDQEQYLFSDFDKDGVANIDDSRPFNKSRGWQKMPKGNGYYAPILWSSPETKLSNELKLVMQYNKSRQPQLRQFLVKNPNSYGRIKSVASTMRKLRERTLEKGVLGDVAAVTIETKNRAAAYAKKKQIRKRYHTSTKNYDNYYAKPKGGKGGHYGLHIALKPHGGYTKHPELMELQVKSHKMREHDDLMHVHYKQKKLTPEDRRRGKLYFEQGY